MRHLTQLLVAALLLLALTVTAARYGLPQLLQHNKEWLLEQFSEMSGQPITASSLTSRWYLTGPELQFRRTARCQHSAAGGPQSRWAYPKA